MPSVASLAAFAGLASLAIGSPIESLKKRNTFSVTQVAQGQVIKNGAIAMSKAFQKYGKKPPTSVSSAAAAAATGEVSANPEQYDSEYLCPVTVGSTTLNLDFDTGSADLWVFSSELPTSQTSGHSVYKPSSSDQLKGYTWDISYGDGSGAKGNVYADKVVVGGVTATSQAVEAATSISSQFTQDTNNDGLLGLAMSSINTVQPKAQTTFFDTVKSTLESALFTVTLKKGEPGSYDFGFIDSSKYTGDITYVDVDDSQGFWGFTVDGYSIGSGSAKTESINAIADTGTTLLLLPTDVVEAYYKQVSGAKSDSSQGGYVFDCSAKLPDFGLSIGGQTLTIPGSYMNYSPATGSECFGGLQDNTGIGLSIVGDIFLKGQFVVFDQTQSSPRLGWAQQAGVSS